jgi:hypothetical protein
MHRYDLTAGAAVVALFFVLAVLTVVMRRQVHEGLYGNPDINPFGDPRFVNSLFGQFGIWYFHKKLYERSAIRTAVSVVLAAILIFAAIGGYAYAHAHGYV